MLFGMPEYQEICELRDKVTIERRGFDDTNYRVDQETCLEIAHTLNDLGSRFKFQADFYRLELEFTDELKSELEEEDDILEHIAYVLEILIQASLQFSDANELGLKILGVSSQPEFWDVINGAWEWAEYNNVTGQLNLIDDSPERERTLQDDDLPKV